MNQNYNWLSELIELSDYNGNWLEYQKKLYEIFLLDFIKETPYFKGKKVRIRRHPKQGMFEHGFFHLITTAKKNAKHVNDRLVDINRCKRIKWNREIIDNYKNHNSNLGTGRIYYYEQKYKGNIRANIIIADEQYKIVVEERKDYCLLITGYYMEYSYTVNREIKKADKYKKQKAPID